MALPVNVTVVQDADYVGFNDGLVAAWGPQNGYLVTSPNVTYIPEIVQGIVSVFRRENGGFGKHDPLQWPQLYTSEYPYLAAIPKGLSPLHDTPSPSHPCASMWTHPSPDQFVCVPNGFVRGFGRWRADFLHALEPLVMDMSSKARQYIPPLSTINPQPLEQYDQQMMMAWLRLRHVTATYRDQVVQLAAVQRNWLLCSAFMIFYDLLSRRPSRAPLPVHELLMGAWTSEPNEAQKLFTLGIPVWLVRASHVVSSDIRVRKFVPLTPTLGLNHCKVGSDVPIYEGLAGPQHLEVTFITPSYMDISRIPTANISDPDDYRAIAPRGARQESGGRVSALQSGHDRRSRTGPSSRIRGQKDTENKHFSPYDKAAQDRSKFAHPSQVRGRDKFQDVTDPWMPPSLPSWDRAMRAVDRSHVAKLATEIWGYWIPEPALLLGPKDRVRLQRYILNWLRAQPVWLYMLQIPGSGAVKVAPQSWRNLLNGVPDDPKSFTQTGKRAYEIKQIFGRVFSDADIDASATGEVEWHQHRLTAVTDQIGPQILWETFELGFRYELWALDRFIRPVRSLAHEADRALCVARVFPSSSLWVVPHIPSDDSWGLFAPLPQRRIISLNALREVLMAWPRCPREIMDGKPLLISDSVETIEEQELGLALFYTQTFFDASGRAPIVPHCYPPGPK